VFRSTGCPLAHRGDVTLVPDPLHILGLPVPDIDVNDVGEWSGTPDNVRVSNYRSPGLQSQRPGLGRGFVSAGSSSDAQLVRSSYLPASLERTSQHQMCRHRLGTNTGSEINQL